MADPHTPARGAENTLAEALIADLAAHSCLFGNGEGSDDCSCWPCRARALASLCEQPFTVANALAEALDTLFAQLDKLYADEKTAKDTRQHVGWTIGATLQVRAALASLHESNQPSVDADELRAIQRRWETFHNRGAHDYTDAGCRVLAEHAFRDIPVLLTVCHTSPDAQADTQTPHNAVSRDDAALIEARDVREITRSHYARWQNALELIADTSPEGTFAGDIARRALAAASDQETT